MGTPGEREGGGGKRQYVRDMFTAIAPRYDFLNHLLSLNFDRRWRRSAVSLLDWQRAPSGRYLDCCAGTLDLAATLGNAPGFSGHVIGADFVQPMLVRGAGKSSRVIPVTADALGLPFGDAHFDGATVGFGVRNLSDLDAGFRELVRVLKPGARLVILEFTTPSWQPMRAGYFMYFRYILPLIGRLVSKHTTAYTYLPESVLNFPEPDALAALMTAAGLREVTYRRLSGGICALHVGRKAKGEGEGRTEMSRDS